MAVSATGDHERGALARLTLLARVGRDPRLGPARARRRCDRVAELLRPGLAAWCAIDVADERRRARPARRACPAAFPLLPPDAPHGPAIVMRTGEPELVREITEDALFAAARGDWAAAECAR